MPYDTMINALNSGELSPKLAGRVEVSRYYSGCRKLENAYAMVSGGATRRPGTYKAAAAKYDAKKCRVKRFEFSVEQTYILEFGDQYIRFFKDGGQILNGAVIYEIASPYLEADLFDLTFAPSADVLYIFHNDYKTRKLTRTGHTSWTLTEAAWTDGPFMSENITESHTLAVSAVTGTGKDLVSTVDLFVAGHVGAIFKLTHEKTATAVSGKLTANGSSASLKVNGEWIFKTGGTWTGKITLDRSLDGGTTWKVIRTEASNDDGNVSTSGEEDIDGALYRVTMSGFASGSATYNLECTEYFRDGIVLIKSVTDAKNAKCDVIRDCEATTATYRWSEGAFSDLRGYPACGTFHEERLIVASTKYQPQSCWGSVIGEFDQFKAGVEDDMALLRTLNSDSVNAIKWIISQNQLLVGTKGAEWKISAADTEKTITPVDAIARRQSKIGSMLGLAELAGDAVLYVQRGGKVVREYAYSYEKEGFVSPPMTFFADHITGDGITNMCYSSQPESVLYCVRSDGQLPVFTYERGQEVFGWARIITAGEIESVDYMPTETEDQIWISAKRTINGETKRFIEYFMPRDFGTDIADAFFVDCGLTFDGGAAVDISDITVDLDDRKVTITSAGHGFTNGFKIKFADIAGMTELNDNVYTVADAAANTYILKDPEAVGYIDGSVFTAYTSGGTAQRVAKLITGLSHLEGETVSILADGSPCPDTIVADGEADCKKWANKIHAGLGYQTIISPMPIEIVGSNGSTAGKVKKIVAAVVKFDKTVGCQVSTNEVSWETMTFRETTDKYGRAVEPWTGEKKIPVNCDYGRSASLTIRQSQPLPMTILSVFPEISF